ncbi:MAG: hypothetical protein V3U13_03955 [Gemmatimonadota bacterium]
MRRLPLAGCLAVLVFAPSVLQAQWNVGGQLSWGTDFDLAFGGRVAYEWPFEAHTETLASFDLFFPSEENLDYWEININIGQPIPVKSDDLRPYAGAGLNWAHISNDRISTNKFGLNLLAGLKYLLPSVTPFGEIRVELGGGKQWVFTGGVMFNITG